MLLRDLIKIPDTECALVFYLSVVKEESLNPHACRSFPRSGRQLGDDAGDGDELDVIRIAHENVIEKNCARRMIVRINEPWHDYHLLSVEGLSLLAGQ